MKRAENIMQTDPAMIKLIVLDIDGVMTDGSKTYGIDGSVIAKTYNDKDFTAIKRFKASGVPVCFLSGDNRINEKMAANRNIDFYYSRGIDKASFVEQFTVKYGAPASEILYIGDDIFDLSLLQVVGYPYCTADSPTIVKNACSECGIVPRKGGENVIAALYDILLDKNLIKDATMEAIEILDKKEIF